MTIQCGAPGCGAPSTKVVCYQVKIARCRNFWYGCTAHAEEFRLKRESKDELVYLEPLPR